MNERDLFDITIIGAGPVGLYGLFYAGMRGMRAKVIESLDQVGGQITAFYPDKYIYDMPGFQKVLGRELVRGLTEQALQFNPAICLGERVLEMARLEDRTIRLTTPKDEHFTRSLVICAGIGAFDVRKLGVPGLAELEGRGVGYKIEAREQYRDRRVVIVGGGDSALDWSLELQGIASSVRVVHMLDKFQGHESSVRKLVDTGSPIHLQHQVTGVTGTERLESITITHNKTKETQTFEADALLIFIGFNTNIGAIQNWGLKLEGKTIVSDENMMTSIPGLFAAGDIAARPAKAKLISIGCGEVATAVNHAKRHIDPDSKVMPGHSSNMAIFKAA